MSELFAQNSNHAPLQASRQCGLRSTTLQWNMLLPDRMHKKPVSQVSHFLDLLMVSYSLGHTISLLHTVDCQLTAL